MFFLSFVLVSPSIAAAAAAGAIDDYDQDAGSCRSCTSARGDRTRKPRGVWSNPIAWREAKTKASAARASVLRYGFIGLGVVGAIVLVVMHAHRDAAQAITSTASSYDPANDTLTVYSNDESRPHTYNVRPADATCTTRNASQAATRAGNARRCRSRIGDLHGRYEVESVQTQP